jgi:hypothetical protein
VTFCCRRILHFSSLAFKISTKNIECTFSTSLFCCIKGFDYLKRHTKMPLILLLIVTRVVWSQTAIFSAKLCSNNVLGSIVLLFGLQLVSRIFEEFQHPAIQTTIVQHFGIFFHQIKVRQPLGRKNSIQTVHRTSRRLDSFLYLAIAAQKFEVFFKYSKLKLKNQKPIAVDALLFKANGTTLIQYPDPIWPDGTL